MIFFLPKSATSVSRSQAYLVKLIHNHIRLAEGKTNYLSNQRKKNSVEKKALDVGLLQGLH